MDNFGDTSHPVKLTRSIIEGVIDALDKQAKLIHEKVTEPLERRVVHDVPSIWKGTGADLFMKEMKTEVIPTLGKIGDQHTNFNRQIVEALEIFSKAENQALPVAEECLSIAKDVVKGIEKGGERRS